MEKVAQIVIGANLGDEGKGLVTDFLSAPYGDEALVIRFNGGAQAGHSVEMSDGHRHVFSHFGSGTLAGASTYLSRFFVCNPLLFLKEWDRLVGYGITPCVFVDPEAMVTTPYDMMMNQMIEEQRGAGRHGSCGVGFGETIERELHSRFQIRVKDLVDRADLRRRLVHIRSQWVAARLARLSVSRMPEVWMARVMSDGIIDMFLGAVEKFMAFIQVLPIERAALGRHLVFEGAQGLLLDQDYRWFPHVTRSHTGLRQVMPLAHDLGLTKLDVHYVTRSYLTRHGAGPLPFELATKPYDGIEDKTNITNAYQGHLRFSWLNLDLLKDAIAVDLLQVRRDPIRMTPRLVVTCLDQIGAVAGVVHQGHVEQWRAGDLCDGIAKAVGIPIAYGSFGPTRQTMIDMPSLVGYSSRRA